MDTGNNIRNIRKEKGMTLQQIANVMGCSPQLISQYESGKRQPKLETLQRIAIALDVNLLDIVDITQLDENTGLQELTNMISQLDIEGLEELKKLLKNDFEDSLRPDKQALIKIYDNMTDRARKKLISYAEDLWYNPLTHRQIKE